MDSFFYLNLINNKKEIKSKVEEKILPSKEQDLQVLHTFHDLMLLDLHDWDCNPPEH